MKNQKGITLVALVITIIVMLILVGVTVNVALTGGLFDTAKLAAKKTETAKLEETIIMPMNLDIAENSEYYIEEGSDLLGILSRVLTKLEENFTVDESAVSNSDGLRFLSPDNVEKVDGENEIYKLTVPCVLKDTTNEINIIVNIKASSGYEILSFSLEK